MKKSALLFLVVTMVGCASSAMLFKPGMTQEQWDRDYYECSVVADQEIGFDTGYRTALGNVIASGGEHRRRFESCCEARGYRKISTDEYDRMTAASR